MGAILTEERLVVLPRPAHEAREFDTLTALKTKARGELNAALRARDIEEIIEWANPVECERKTSYCLLGTTTGFKCSYFNEEVEGRNFPGSQSGVTIHTPDGIEDIRFYSDSALVLLVKLFDQGVLAQLEAL